MIITKAPFRVSLFGGSTDYKDFYENHGSLIIGTTIDKYVYITIHKNFSREYIIKYSQMERVNNINDIHHPIIRESLKEMRIDNDYIEIISMADIPAGTGLGSSGSFTTALLKALHTHKRHVIHQSELAEMACDIEINKLGEPIGKQDQYIASYGGITCFEFNKDGTVKAWPLNISKDTLYNLEDNLLLFFTGYSRAASTILKEQNDKSKTNNQEMIDNLHYVKDLGYQSREALEKGDVVKFGELMNVHWEHKKKRSGSMSNKKIDEWYSVAIGNGAVGGKLIGAGGGGFLMFYASDSAKLRQAMFREGLEEVRFKFDFIGSEVVIQS